ncbi:MAG: penicillin-insensitive murein endopeptidase [Actinomycetota bacterium]|nr:penicillin-insensitive murein endopeptidase [Actinomycetota bacterium]
MLRSTLIAAVAALTLAPGAGAEAFDTANGISGRLPAGWRVVDRYFTNCVDPREVLAVSSFRVGAKPVLPRRGAFFVLEETNAYVNRFPARPGRFRLVGKPSGLECCVPLHAPGWVVHFRAAGRGFYAYVFLGPDATRRTRSKLLGVLDSLRFRPFPRPRWRRSVALGGPAAGGRLVDGVLFPAFGERFFTWDPLLHRSPDRPWRRWGTARLVRTVLSVVQDAGRDHYLRIGVGDLSRRGGGPFGPRHASHQNGLDADVYYPRRDRLERPPDRVGQIDRRLSQVLVDRFVRAGAAKIFVGPNTGLRGPSGIVQPLRGHDNHLHVRLPGRDRGALLGRSSRGREIRGYERGNPLSPRRVLVFGCVHGTHCPGLAVTERLLAAQPADVDLWIVPTLNDEGLEPRARATTIARRLIAELRPDATISFDRAGRASVRGSGKSALAARRFARRVGASVRAAPRRPRQPAVSLLVELPPRDLTPTEVSRYAAATIRAGQ